MICNSVEVDRLDKGADSRETFIAREHLKNPPTAFVLGGVFRMSEEKRPRLWLDVAEAVARRTRIFGSLHAGMTCCAMRRAVSPCATTASTKRFLRR